MSTERYYPDDIAELRKQDAALADQFSGFTGITSVLNWMHQSGLTRSRTDMIGQDEFHYDFLIELEPAGRWVAFGVT